MTEYRRLYVPGGTYFFTLNLQDSRSTALVDHIDALRAAWGETCRERPFRTEAAVVLPDHLHAIWTLPPYDADFSTRWRLIKSRFSRRAGIRGRINPSKRKKGERGVWQRRYWEHAIRGKTDFALHQSYCWQDPMRHGLVARSEDWPFSSFKHKMEYGPDLSDFPPIQDGTFGERMGEDHPSYAPVTYQARF